MLKFRRYRRLQDGLRESDSSPQAPEVESDSSLFTTDGDRKESRTISTAKDVVQITQVAHEQEDRKEDDDTSLCAEESDDAGKRVTLRLEVLTAAQLKALRFAFFVVLLFALVFGAFEHSLSRTTSPITKHVAWTPVDSDSKFDEARWLNVSVPVDSNDRYFDVMLRLQRIDTNQTVPVFALFRVESFALISS
ncbi:MAG: hypothetical protein MHM6MM_008402 [Cercozoa sp. M6MM]